MAAGVTWTGGVHWLGVVSATITAAVVARLLVPADFAVVVAAGALAGVVGILQESGLAAAVVQYRGDGRRAATTALLLHLAAGTVAVLGCVAVSPWLAAFFHLGDARVLAAAFVPLWLRAWTGVPVALLQRELAFERAALVEAASVVAYPAVTIPLAYGGHGAWALVLGQGAAALAAALAAWLLAGWRPRIGDVDRTTARALVRYGRTLTGSNLLAVVNDRVDNFVVGRASGPEALGLYAMAFRLATLPRTGFTFVVSRVLFPALAGLQGDVRRVREVYLGALHWVAALALPATAGLALLAPLLVDVVLGPRWHGAVAPLRVLTVFGLTAALAATTGDVFKASGRPALVLRIGFVHSAVLWSGLALLGGRGATAVAGAVALAGLASGTTAFVFALGVLHLRPAALWRALRAPALATAVMAAVLALAPEALPLAGAAALGVQLGLGMAVYAGALAWLAPEDARELAGLVRAFAAARRRRGEVGVGSGSPAAGG